MGLQSIAATASTASAQVGSYNVLSCEVGSSRDANECHVGRAQLGDGGGKVRKGAGIDLAKEMILVAVGMICYSRMVL